MTPRLQRLFDLLSREVCRRPKRLGEITVVSRAANLETPQAARPPGPALRAVHGPDRHRLRRVRNKPQARFAVALQLLSVTHNWRLRRAHSARTTKRRCCLRSARCGRRSTGTSARRSTSSASCSTAIDLRRILTDYGFIGHPFRKDFPVRARGDALRPGRSASSTSR